MTAREASAKTVMEILDKRMPSHIAIPSMIKKNQDWSVQDRGFAKRLTDGTVRRLETIDYLLSVFSKTSVNKMKPWIRAVLRIGVYQLMYCEDIPQSAACNEAVKLVKKYGFTNLSGYVNAVLRSVARDGKIRLEQACETSIEEELRLQYSVPLWLIRQWERDYGEEVAQKIVAATVVEKHLTIRCNCSRVMPEQLVESLTAEGIRVEAARYAENAFYLYGCDGLESLEAFQKGWFQIQDESSILVGQAAGIRGDECVLDLCAAPGGKSLHIADILESKRTDKSLPGGQVEARDVSEAKLELIRENLRRIRLENVITVCADATVFDAGRENSADVVIADVPCSGTGVIARKPDIKYNMNEETQNELCALQKKILQNAVRYVKPGGALIFSTCTLNREENDSGRTFLLEQGMQADSLIPYLPKCLHNEDAKQGFLRLIPGVHETDGFYIARFIKR